ncbi:MAG: hypothetical protein ACFE68_00635 [Candidatus Hodarchaeota archaeon]
MTIKSDVLTIKKIKGGTGSLTDIEKVKCRNEMILEIFKTKKRMMSEEAAIVN